MIGTLTEAKIVATLKVEDLAQLLSDGYDYDTHSYPPQAIPGLAGWFAIGSGGTRIAVLSPTNVIYKLARYGCHHNRLEFDNYNRVPKIIDGYRIPSCHLYIINTIEIIAMEYITRKFKGDWDEFDTIEASFSKIGLSVFHRDNLGVDDSGMVVLLDLGD
jgi:hypothetical protein